MIKTSASGLTYIAEMKYSRLEHKVGKKYGLAGYLVVPDKGRQCRINPASGKILPDYTVAHLGCGKKNQTRPNTA